MTVMFIVTFLLLLSGLLDYEEVDDAEPQMELALLAEGLHEMLMKGYGDAIARALLADRWVDS
jgi:hypothetical protein